MTSTLTPEQKTNDVFVPFVPIPINSMIFLEPEITPIEKNIIALAEIFRHEIEVQRTPEKRKEVAANIRASRFCEPLQKSRDHVRRIITAMNRKDAVRKYLSFHFVRDKIHNSEDQILIHFKNHRIDSLVLNTVGTERIYGEEQLPYEQNLILSTYLKQSKLFYKHKPLALAKICDVQISELVKGLVYVDLMNEKKLREKKPPIENEIGYLIRCFDPSGKMMHEIKPYKYLSNNTRVTAQSNVEYEMSKASFGLFQNAIQSHNENKVKMVWREDNGNVYLKTVSKCNKKWNPVSWLKKYNIEFKIVSELIGGGE